MLMSESVFEWMIIIALILSCVAPVILLLCKRFNFKNNMVTL